MLDPLKQAADTRRLYHQIADQIRGLIDKGGYAPGSRLPPERDLAQQLGVSRPSVREALIALEIAGVVEVRMGAGVYVCPPAQRQSLALASLGESPSELMQARALFEGSVVALACAKATAGDIVHLRAVLQRMRQAVAQGQSPIALDREFHVGLAAITGNGVLQRMTALLFDERHSPVSERLSARVESEYTWESAVQEHEAIVGALEQRDPLAAQTAMRLHLQESERRWVGA
ncbi:FadR family transcriptional regulator [Curvibacter sp. CHRR-16]|uniref:FadR/GntR family transcriptional regulator n=1 Tax=Curvibacter sp. CHRR-16 TaxID=2835872 RepID=UPI001BD91BF5|nr:FadR/GntR family transcriptional regulator [Curvibacter sp. CHRR-16]MBT0569471.1 FadR family transcriptional regulator [Curvibacter sp. CHRR-16]